MTGIEAVRARPGMYVGDVLDGSGLHEMLFEVVKNALAEGLAGHCDRVDVELKPDGSATIRDNGRGIPTEIFPAAPWKGASAAEIVMTQVAPRGEHARAERNAAARLRGIGVAVVNALSEMLEVRIWRNRKEYRMRYRKGWLEAPTAVRVIPEGEERRGTEIIFRADAAIFSAPRFDFDRIEARLRSLADLDLGVTLSLSDKRPAEQRLAMLRL